MTDVREANVRHISSLYVVFPVERTKKKVNTRLSINPQEDNNQLKEKTNKNHPV